MIKQNYYLLHQIETIFLWIGIPIIKKIQIVMRLSSLYDGNA